MPDLKKIISFTSILLPLVYFFGFISVNGQLSNYDFSDIDFFSSNYIKTGVLFTLWIAIIFYSIYVSYDEETMTDDASKSWQSLLLSLSNVSVISLMMIMFLGQLHSLKEHKTLLYTSIALLLVFSLLRLYLMNKIPKNNKGVILITLLPVLIILPVFIIVAYHSKLALSILLFNLAVSIFINLFLGDYGDKNIKARIATDTIGLIVLSFAFGKYISSDLPRKYGGSKPYQIYTIDNSFDEKNHITSDTTIYEVLFENSDRLLLKENNGSIKFILKGTLPEFYIYLQDSTIASDSISGDNKKKIINKKQIQKKDSSNTELSNQDSMLNIYPNKVKDTLSTEK